MDVTFKVKNMSKALKPREDDVMLFDGKLWYITTKQALFKEYDKELLKLKTEKEQLLQEYKEFKTEIAKQMLEYGKIIQEFVKGAQK